MSNARVIPRTERMHRYQRLRKKPQAERLDEAQRLVADPHELAAEFAASVQRFASYDNLTDHFYPPDRAEHEFREELERTNDLVLRLQAQQQVTPVDAAERLTTHDAGQDVVAVPASALAFDYVDRELLVQRTTSPARWDDGKPNRGGVRLDVLLCDREVRTPIVGELKLPGDMDPFFALVQALACAAHLATPNQYERMRRHLPHAQFPELAAPPRLDVFVLFVDAAGVTGRTRKPKYMTDLKAAAEALAPRLLADEAIGGSLRRMAGLGMSVDSTSRTVTTEVRWAWQRTRNDSRASC